MTTRTYLLHWGLGVEVLGGTTQQFAATIKADTAKWAKVVKDAGIQVD